MSTTTIYLKSNDSTGLTPTNQLDYINLPHNNNVWSGKNFLIDRSLLQSNTLLAGTYDYNLLLGGISDSPYTTGVFKVKMFYYDADLASEVVIKESSLYNFAKDSYLHSYSNSLTLTQPVTLGPNQYLYISIVYKTNHATNF